MSKWKSFGAAVVVSSLSFGGVAQAKVPAGGFDYAASNARNLSINAGWSRYHAGTSWVSAKEAQARRAKLPREMRLPKPVYDQMDAMSGWYACDPAAGFCLPAVQVLGAATPKAYADGLASEGLNVFLVNSIRQPSYDGVGIENPSMEIIVNAQGMVRGGVAQGLFFNNPGLCYFLAISR